MSATPDPCIEEPLDANVAFQAESSEYLLVDEKLMTRPQRDSAIGAVPARQTQRRSGALSFLSTIWQDVRFAARQLSKGSGFAFTATTGIRVGYRGQYGDLCLCACSVGEAASLSGAIAAGGSLRTHPGG